MFKIIVLILLSLTLINCANYENCWRDHSKDVNGIERDYIYCIIEKEEKTK